MRAGMIIFSTSGTVSGAKGELVSAEKKEAAGSLDSGESGAKHFRRVAPNLRQTLENHSPFPLSPLPSIHSSDHPFELEPLAFRLRLRALRPAGGASGRRFLLYRLRPGRHCCATAGEGRDSGRATSKESVSRMISRCVACYSLATIYTCSNT